MSGFKQYDQYDGFGLAALVRKGEITAAELCEEAIERVERVNPRLNAVIAPLENSVLILRISRRKEAYR